MAMIVHTCPHCATNNTSLVVVHVAARRDDGCFNALLQCQKCRGPACAVMSPNVEIAMKSAAPEFRNKGMRDMVFQQIWSQGFPQDGDVLDNEWKLDHFWPEPPKPRLPDGLPSEVARAFLAAERNYPQVGMEEASGGSYRRALDVGTKIIARTMPNATDFEGKQLNNRIDMLRKHGRLTQDLADWAHQIKGLGNEAMHELDEVTREELTALRGFTELVLTYLFTLPGMLAARQAEGA